MTGVENLFIYWPETHNWDWGGNFSKYFDQGSYRSAYHRGTWTGSFIKFFDIFEMILDSHASLKKLCCSLPKLYLKLWITPGIWKSMKVKNRLQKKFLRAKNLIRKDALHNEVKQYRNYINILTKSNKANHYQKSSQDHKINLCKTWEGVKMIININKTTKK